MRRGGRGRGGGGGGGGGDDWHLKADIQIPLQGHSLQPSPRRHGSASGSIECSGAGAAAVPRCPQTFTRRGVLATPAPPEPPAAGALPGGTASCLPVWTPGVTVY
ncbi:hypothetical protein JYU34_007869 [Plutella xylostella]|uniref:Uncharacterized protein n=1 Tax=Plutella xylostella TaxID=51655 RepID=A0ABQ7QRK0_PLUXY|nr:hypothetical protein JYU34_007869 [Plutella xylostella]